MEEIGNLFMTTRESAGVSLKEASEDLDVDEVILENIEDGKPGAFSDVFELKECIINYAKYLGLNKEDLVDEFNEYLFDYTSKLSLEEIKKARKEEKKDKIEKKIKSPYTIERKSGIYIPPILIYGAIIILIILLLILIITSAK